MKSPQRLGFHSMPSLKTMTWEWAPFLAPSNWAVVEVTGRDWPVALAFLPWFSQGCWLGTFRPLCPPRPLWCLASPGGLGFVLVSTTAWPGGEMSWEGRSRGGSLGSGPRCHFPEGQREKKVTGSAWSPWESTSRCWYLPPRQEVRQVAEPTLAPYLAQNL